MIKSFEIQNFRCFKDFKIDALTRINLIVGKNNVGKTALLEALWIYYGYYNPIIPISVDNFRGVEKFNAKEFLWDIFNGFDPSKIVKLVSREIGGHKRTITIKVVERIEQTDNLDDLKFKRRGTATQSLDESQYRPGPSEIIIDYVDSHGDKSTSRAYIVEDKLKSEQARGAKRIESIFLPNNRKETNEERAERFTKVVKNRSSNKIIEALKIFDERIEDVQILYVAGDPVLHASLNGEKELYPLPVMGDGIRRILSIALAIAYASGGAVFIDEIENGLHYSVMSKIGQSIAELANLFDVQVFATSHSFECINAIRKGVELSSIKEEIKEEMAKLFRLENVDNQIRAVSYTFEELEIASSHGIEVR